MPKKNFKAATQDIFGEYQQPKETPSTIEKNQEDIYELFLLSIKSQQLEQLKSEAKTTNLEVRDVLSTILNKHFTQ